MLYESIVGQCEYTTQPKGSFWCHVIDTKVALSLSIFINKFVLVLYLSFSFRHIFGRIKAAAEPREWSNLVLDVDNFTTYRISRLIRYGQLSCIEFYSCHLQQCLSIEFSYLTPGHGQKGPVNKACLSFCPEVILELALGCSLELSMLSDAQKIFLPPKWGKQAQPRVIWMHRKT